METKMCVTAISILAIFMSTSIKMCKGHAYEDLQKLTMTQPCEIAVLWDDSAGDKVEFEMMLDYTRRLPDYFPMGDNFTRMAVIRYGGVKPKIVLKLTSDEKAVRALQATMQSAKSDKLSPALQDVRNEFANARPNAKKIVFIMADGNLGDDTAKGLQEVSDLKKNDGYDFYVGLPERAVGSPPHMQQIAELLNLTALDRMIRLKCFYEEVCRFTDQLKCEAAWIHTDPDAATQCNNAPPAQTQLQCPETECWAKCDQWKWKDDPTCQPGDEGKNLPREREGPMPGPTPIFDNCPRTTEGVVCSTEQSKPPVKEPTPDDGGDGEFPGWAIGLIIGLILLILLAIIIALVVVSRERKNRAMAEAMTKKKALHADSTISSRSKALPSMALAPEAARAGVEHSVSADMDVSRSLAMKKGPMQPMPKSTGGGPKLMGPMKSAGTKK